MNWILDTILYGFGIVLVCLLSLVVVTYFSWILGVAVAFFLLGLFARGVYSLCDCIANWLKPKSNPGGVK